MASSSKMSARQKMINMMYLVLTALLALNISSEILQAFEKLRYSLEITSGSYTIKNDQLAQGVSKAINDELKTGDSTHYALFPVLEEVKSEPEKLLTMLGKITDALKEIGEVDPKTGDIIRKDERDGNYRYWMGTDDVSNSGHGNGKASELREKLDGFIQWANSINNKYNVDSTEKNVFAKLTALKSSLEGQAESTGKTWEYETFHGTPVIADLAMVEKFKMDVKQVQSDLLNVLNENVKGQIFNINKLMAMEAPTSRIVPAGLDFETKLFVGMSSDNIKPEFLGRGISLDPGGMTATMKIAANGSVIPNGKNEGVQRYTAMIKVPKANGTFEELPLEGEFIVRTPEVVVRSKTVQMLYKDCGNAVVVDVPALGDQYNPDFSKSQGGRVITANGSKKDITLVPSRPSFKLSVYSKTNGQNVRIDDITYNVIRPPAPRMSVSYRGKELDGRAPVNKRQTLKVKLVPNDEFKRDLPKDARYKVGKVKLLHQNGLTAPRVVATKTGNIMAGIDMNLYQGTIKNAQPGDRIYIEIEDVSRVNFEGRSIREDIPMTDLLQGLIIRQ